MDENMFSLSALKISFSLNQQIANQKLEWIWIMKIKLRNLLVNIVLC